MIHLTSVFECYKLCLTCVGCCFASHLLDPRSRSELAFDTLADGENAIGEEKPERGRAGKETGPIQIISTHHLDKVKVTPEEKCVRVLLRNMHSGYSHP